MPELKVLAGPVQPVKIETVEQPHDESDLSVVKKKSPHLKKLVRKSSIDKGKEKVPSDPSNNKLNNILKDKNKISNLTDRLAKLTPPKKQTKPKEQSSTTVADSTQEQQENVEIPEQKVENEVEAEAEPEPEPEPVVEPAPKPKKPRQIKKKVIIKRQQRRLSIGDTFFIQQEPEEPKVPEIETIEKAIAYVTDDEEDLEPLPEQEPAKPLKSCLHVREYKIGDLILYAERYRKTQVRWKRGRVLERITSISYKLEIEGKEVPAHISYIKKYTGRKVKFVGKEYLDIDYEQVVEEERRARSYSIWNMV
ncbi:zinc metalloprotease ZmpB [Drosophila albomicans]|uniref:Zinc metalloprotease ZmpB n=1 Tax=Drosophila albomicans TaxID=7291 RepID=A0A6P8X4F0_DROAB|nr:zinc metalloprotease ZmpB [Drosophila albomicans]